MTTQGVVKRLKSWVPKALVAPPLLVTKIRTAAKRAGSAMTSEPVREYQVLVGEPKVSSAASRGRSSVLRRICS